MFCQKCGKQLPEGESRCFECEPNTMTLKNGSIPANKDKTGYTGMGLLGGIAGALIVLIVFEIIKQQWNGAKGIESTYGTVLIINAAVTLVAGLLTGLVMSGIFKSGLFGKAHKPVVMIAAVFFSMVFSFYASAKAGNVRYLHKLLEKENVIVFCSPGSGDGQLNSPRGIAISNMGFLYVADGVNNRIQKFTSRGKFVKAWGREGPGKGEFREVSSVAVDDDGNVYAADTWNQRIQVFDDEGNYISEIKDDFYGPRNVAVNWRKNVYVADTGMRRVALYDKTGKKIIDSRKFEKTGGVKLGEVYGLAIDSDNRVIVTDSECRPYIYSERLYRIKASDDEKMAVRGNVWPFIAVDKYNFIYLVDTNNKEVLVGRIIGNDIVKLGDIVFDEQDFLVGPIGIAADIRGNVYIADDAKKRIIRFTPKYSMDWFIKMDYYVSRAFGLIMRLFI